MGYPESALPQYGGREVRGPEVLTVVSSMTTPHDGRDHPRAWYREHRAGIIAGLADPARSDYRRAAALVMLVLDDDPATLAQVDVAQRVAVA